MPSAFLGTNCIGVSCLLCGATNAFESNDDKSSQLVIAKERCWDCHRLIEAWVHKMPTMNECGELWRTCTGHFEPGCECCPTLFILRDIRNGSTVVQKPLSIRIMDGI